MHSWIYCLYTAMHITYLIWTDRQACSKLMTFYINCNLISQFSNCIWKPVIKNNIAARKLYCKYFDPTKLWILNSMVIAYSMPQTVWNTENVSKGTSNVQLLSSTASTNWITYSWLTSNPKISIWVHTRAKIHSFSKCQNSDHFWGCEKSILQIQPDHNETCL